MLTAREDPFQADPFRCRCGDGDCQRRLFADAANTVAGGRRDAVNASAHDAGCQFSGAHDIATVRNLCPDAIAVADA